MVSRKTFFGIMFGLVLLVSLMFSGAELSAAEDEGFVLLEGDYIDLYMPENSSGLNFLEVLTDFEAAKVCDIGYMMLNEIVGGVPFSGNKITITAEGYDGEENFPGYAGHSGNPIVVVYNRLSQRNYILSYTPEDGENALPNFGLYFHEMYHDFQPFAFSVLLPSYGEGFATFMSSFIETLVINEAQNYGLNQSNVDKIYSNKEWSLDLARWLDPQTANFSESQKIFVYAFLHEVANDYEDYGKSVFTSFFELVEESYDYQLFDVQTEVEINSLFIALINSAAYSDYRSVYEYYTFETDPDLYESYKEALNSLLPIVPPERLRCVSFGDDIYVVRTSSNSLVSDLTLNQTAKSLRFTVEGPAGTEGFCNIIIPAELLSGDFTVFIDGLQLIQGVDYSSSFNGTHHTLNVEYEHSSHTIEIVGTTAVPEFVGWLFLPFFMSATLLGLALRKRLKTQ
jgi:hypothetical protein